LHFVWAFLGSGIDLTFGCSQFGDRARRPSNLVCAMLGERPFGDGDAVPAGAMKFFTEFERLREAFIGSPSHGDERKSPAVGASPEELADAFLLHMAERRKATP
jgi:hypothetical protein